MFRVVADQLKLRGGLVRCGQCRTVFDAIGSLAYVEDATLNSGRLGDIEAATIPAAAPVAAAQPPPAPVPAPAAVPVSAPAAKPRARAEERPREKGESRRKVLGPATTLRIAPGAAPAATLSEVRAVPAAPRAASFEEQALAEGGVPTLLAAGAADAATELPRAALEGIEVIEVPPVAEPIAVEDNAEEPKFLKATRPRRGFSIVFGGGSLLLALLALAQLAVMFRSDVLKNWPGVRPALVAACDVLRCSVGWPTQPDQLAVIASELQAIPGTDVLELTTVIRNRAAFTQALPALEVTLSDTQNRPVARKVFTPADYLEATRQPAQRIDEGLAPGADLTIRLFIETRGLQPAGFLVYPFYI
jgi:predicted Zn finger-like uncharacterized protein